MKKLQNLKMTAAGFIMVAIILYGGWWLLHDLSKEYIVALISAAASVSGIIYSNAKAKEKENTARLHSEKAAAYSKAFSLVSDMLHREKLGKKPLTEKEIMKTLIETKESFMIWASEETLFAFDEISNAATPPEETQSTALLAENMGRLFLAMRKDLGHRDIKMTPKKIISFYLDAAGKKEILE